MKNIGSVKENLDTEKRISITPETAKEKIFLKKYKYKKTKTNKEKIITPPTL